MKKTIALLVVLCLAVSLFAAGSVKVGGSFESIIGKTNEFKSEGSTTGIKAEYKSHGFGFNVSGRYDVTGNLSAWASFGMSFCSDVKFKAQNSDDWYSIKEEYEDAKKDVPEEVKVGKKTNAISAAAGVAAVLPLNAPVEVAIGGGVYFERLIGEVSLSGEILGVTYNRVFGMKLINVGISAYADVAYKINDSFGVGLTIMPRLGLLNFGKNYMIFDSATNEAKASGFAIGFSMPVVVGVSYAF